MGVLRAGVTPTGVKCVSSGALGGKVESGTSGDASSASAADNRALDGSICLAKRELSRRARFNLLCKSMSSRFRMRNWRRAWILVEEQSGLDWLKDDSPDLCR